LANLRSISEKLKRIELKKEPEEVDDEILLNNIIHTNLTGFTNEDLKEIVKISKDASNRLKDFFLIAKSIWSIVFDSVLIIQKNKHFKITEKNFRKGYLYFDYNNEKYLYEYHISKIDKKYEEQKCLFKLIENGNNINIEKRLKNNIVFFANFDNEFPLEGCLLSIVKRKVISYITQTIKLDELKESNEKEK
jgi:hypothetical protein